MKSAHAQRIVCVAAALMLAMLAAQEAPAQTYTVLYTVELPGTYYQVGPDAGVIFGNKGTLFGSTGGGGLGYGTVFKLRSTGKQKVLYKFKPQPDGSGPAGILRDKEGNFYGNSFYGGTYNFGTIFKLTRTRQETVLYSFTAGADGAYPQTPLLEDSQGNLYGTAFSYGGSSAGGTIFELSNTGVFTVLYTFGGKPDGARPCAGLIRDSNGNFYGTTGGGGVHGFGSVFEFSNTGKETVLYSFQGGSDGENPLGGVIRDAQGNLYGTTGYGGTDGGGTVFMLSPTGTETLLHTFSAHNGDAYSPNAGLIQDAQGNLYGTTSYGGAYGAGTVFKLSKSGQETVLYSFTGLADGGLPIAPLIQDAEGNLYGTTPYGGDLNCGTEQSGCGVVFKITP